MASARRKKTRMMTPVLMLKILCLFLVPGAVLGSRVAAAQDNFILGADVSFIQQLEQNGAVYKKDGEAEDILLLLKAKGINTIRLRLWHTPDEGLNGLPATLELAQRIKAAGLGLLLDFHYSDAWADPGKQTKPAVWQGLTFGVLQDSLYNYTHQVMAALVAQGTPPQVVQVGNEIIQGMLWDEGRVGGSFNGAGQWANLASLLNTAIDAVHDAAPQDSVEIMIHIDRGGDLAGATWFFDNLSSQTIDFDLIGLSYYPWWHGSMAAMEQTINTVAERYNKPVVLVETAYPWTLGWFDNTNNLVGLPEHLLPGYDASPEGQYQFLRDVIEKVRAVPGERGRGLAYWAPEYIAVAGVGSPWENVALFDDNGEALMGLDAFGASSSVGTEEDNLREDGFDALVYPNPFTTSFVLTYTLREPAKMTISIFDMLGRKVLTVLNDQWQNAGSHRMQVQTGMLRPGVYGYRIASERINDSGLLMHL